jgi:hypothetical protein
VKKLLFGVLVFGFFALLVWGSDRITMQGERTIYTVDCEGGAWTGTHCGGRLVAGSRYAFRASALRKEVIYWTRGTSDPSGTYSDCNVVDRDNWVCKVRADQPAAITHEMKNGRPMRDAQVQTPNHHDVAKWKWWALRLGLPGFADSDG